jgi:hypothetical protein
MSTKKLCLLSLIHALLASLYIFLVSLLLQNGETIFESEKNLFIPVFMLSLLTFSVAFMGVLIFGRPIKLYLDNHKKESINFLIATLG